MRPLPTSVRRDPLIRSLPSLPAGHVVLGLGGDSATPVTVDLFDRDARWLIAGPVRSGRSVLLRSILEQCLDKGYDLVVAAPRRSPLAPAAARTGVTLVQPGDELPAGPAATANRLILVDDSEAFRDTPTDAYLCELAQHCGDQRLAMVVSGLSEDLAMSYRGVAAEIRRAHTGVLLRPAPGDGEVLGTRLPRVRASPIPGRGILVADQAHLATLQRSDRTLAIQVAW